MHPYLVSKTRMNKTSNGSITKHCGLGMKRFEICAQFALDVPPKPRSHPHKSTSIHTSVAGTQAGLTVLASDRQSSSIAPACFDQPPKKYPAAGNAKLWQKVNNLKHPNKIECEASLQSCLAAVSNSLLKYPCNKIAAEQFCRKRMFQIAIDDVAFQLDRRQALKAQHQLSRHAIHCPGLEFSRINVEMASWLCKMLAILQRSVTAKCQAT